MRGSIRRRGRGYSIVYRDPDGKQNWKAYPTKREAERALNSAVEKVNTLGYVCSNVTFGDFVKDHYLPDIEQRVCAKTFERYDEIIRHRLLPEFGSRKLSEIAPPMIAAAHRKWMATPTRRGRPPSPQTVLHFHRRLTHIFSTAERLELVARNPASKVMPPKVEPPDTRALDETEANRLLDAAKDTELELPLTVILYAGLRRGELCGLGWNQVDFERGCITITRTVEDTKKRVAFKEPKTRRGRRQVSLPPWLMDRLKDRKAKQYPKCDLVFPDPVTKDGAIWRPEAFGKAFVSFIKVAGVPRLRLHDLRHTNITLLLKSGVPMLTVSHRVGHARSSFTLDRYGHVVGTMDTDATASLDNALAAARSVSKC